MSTFFPPGTLSAISWLLLSVFCGFMIGLERSLRQKVAGVRTHTLLSLASALFMLLSGERSAQSDADLSMIGCQIVVGINFICAGVIYRNRQKVAAGLTTAAGLLTTTAVGMACGVGMIGMAILGTVLILAAQLILNRLHLGGSSSLPQTLEITFVNSPEIWELLRQKLQEHQIQILSASVQHQSENNITSLSLRIKADQPLSFETALHCFDQHRDILEIAL